MSSTPSDSDKFFCDLNPREKKQVLDRLYELWKEPILAGGRPFNYNASRHHMLLLAALSPLSLGFSLVAVHRVGERGLNVAFVFIGLGLLSTFLWLASAISEYRFASAIRDKFIELASTSAISTELLIKVQGKGVRTVYDVLLDKEAELQGIGRQVEEDLKSIATEGFSKGSNVNVGDKDLPNQSTKRTEPNWP